MTLLDDAAMTSNESAGRTKGRAMVPRALFPEADEHRRFRRWRLALAVAGALVVGGAGFGVTAAFGSGGPSTFALSAASFSTSVGAATQTARSARIAVSVDSGVGRDRCVKRSRPTASGVVDFSERRLLLDRAASACGPLGANPSTTRAEVVGRKVFFYSPSAAALHRRGPSVWHTLLTPPASGAAIYSEPIGRALSPAPWRVLAGLTGEVRVVGHTTIRSVKTTEYRGHASLAGLIAVYPSIRDSLNGGDPRAPLSRLLPPASTIHVPVLIWLDAEHRLRRLELSEPDFEAKIPHTKDAWIPGSDLPRTMSVPRKPNHPGSGLVTVHLAHVRAIGTARIAIDLYDYGTAVHISEPRTSHVAA